MTRAKVILIAISFIFPLTLYAPNLAFSTINNIETISETINKIELELFLNALGNEETGDTIKYPNCWRKVNSIGAMGRWQFMPIALKDLGYRGSYRQFLNCKITQKKYIIKLLKRNKQILDYNNCTKYIGTKVRGINITLSGALAASHLSGVGGLKKFILTGYNSTDGNGSVKKYLIKFKDYNIEQIL